MKVQTSHHYGSRRLPINGGGVVLSAVTATIDTDLDDDFDNEYDTSLWTESLTNATIETDGAGHRVYFDVDPSGGAVDAYLVSDYTVDDSQWSVDFGYNLYDLGNALNGEHKICVLDCTTAGSQFIKVEVIREDDAASGPTQRVEVSWEDDSVTGSGSFAFSKSVGDLRLVYANGHIAVYDMQTGECGYSSPFTMAIPEFTFAVGVEAPSSSNPWRMRLRPFRHVPVITGMWDFRGAHTPLVTGWNSTGVRAVFWGGYPGSFTPTVHGVGTGYGTSETATDSVVVYDSNTEDPGWSLMASNVEEVYDSFEGILVCRDLAVLNPNNKKDTIVPMECFDDGSALDSSSVDIVTEKSGELERARGNFKISDSNSIELGESFRFDRILQSVDESLSVDPEAEDIPGAKHIEYMRTLEMSNGDRAYYGMCDSYSEDSNGDVEVEFVNNPGSGSWEIVSVGPDGTETQIATATFAAGDFTQAIDDDGHYILRGTSSESFSANIFNTDGSEPMLLESSATDGVIASLHGVTELHFTYKRKTAQHLFILYHDVSEGTAVMYEQQQEDTDVVLVSPRNHSISAFETEAGDICIVYQKMETFGFLQDADRRLHYQIFDVSAGTFGSFAGEREIVIDQDLPSDVFYPTGASKFQIRAFDLVKTAETYQLFLSVQFRVQGFYYTNLNGVSTDGSGNRLEESVARGPFLSDGFYVLEWGVDEFSFDSLEDLRLDGVSVTQVACESYKNLFRYRVPDYSGTGKRIIRAEIDKIKAEYDPVRDLTVVTVIDYFHKLPTIFAGNRTRWHEIAVPFHFDIPQYLLEDNQGTPITSFDYFGIESCHATWGYDGFIYSVATRPLADQENSVELMLIDSELYDDPREAMVEKGRAYGQTDPTILENFDIFYPKFRQVKHPMFNTYGDTDGPRHAAVTRVNQYLVVPFSGFSPMPFVVQGVEYDTFPFATSETDVWIPEYGDQGVGGWYDFGSSSSTINKTHVLMPESLNNACLFGKELTSSNTPERSIVDQWEAAQVGYKFHWRALIGLGSGGVPTDVSDFDTMPSKEHRLVGRFVFVNDESERFGVLTKFTIGGTGGDENDLVCEVWDGSSWNVVHTFEDYLSSPEIVDYFILGQCIDTGANSTPQARIMFGYKRRELYHSDQTTPEYYEDYRAYGDQVLVEVDCEVLTTETSQLYASSATHAGSSEDNALMLLQSGWGLLNPENAFVYENPKGAGQDFRWVPPGTRFRSFNERWLLSRSPDDGPSYYFRPSTRGITSGVTTKLHWPNGFRYRFGGKSVAIGDRWTLSREIVLNTSWLASKRLHGYWYTQDDDEDIYIWVDAQDSGLDKFYADVFMVLGYNAKEVTLVGRDDLESGSWTEIETLDMTRYSIDSNQYATAVGSKVKVTTPASLIAGLGVDDLYWSEQGKRDAKLLKVHENKAYLDTQATHADGVASVFGTKGVKTLDTPVRYRYLGVKVSARDTYEGYFVMHTFDFGYASPIPLPYQHSVGSGYTLTIEPSEVIVSDEQSAMGHNRVVAEYALEYRVLDRLTYAKLVSIADKVTHNRRPVWVFQDRKRDPSKVDLCILTGSVNHGLIVDENNDEYYRLTISARVVK